MTECGVVVASWRVWYWFAWHGVVHRYNISGGGFVNAHTAEAAKTTVVVDGDGGGFVSMMVVCV